MGRIECSECRRRCAHRCHPANVMSQARQDGQEEGGSGVDFLLPTWIRYSKSSGSRDGSVVRRQTEKARPIQRGIKKISEGVVIVQRGKAETLGGRRVRLEDKRVVVILSRLKF